MSTYYRSETKISSPFSAYMIVGSMSCSLKESPLTGPECPLQTIDFKKMSVGAALPTGQVSDTTSPLSELGSAYPGASKFSIYQPQQ
jgi:hypothetical protein